MDDQSLAFIKNLDFWMAMAVIAVVVLVSSVVHKRQESSRKHTDPKVLDLLEYLGAHRPHPQMKRHCKPKP